MSAAINRKAGLYLADDGEVYPITNWLCEGDDCDPADATVCVAGRDDRWFSINLADFEATHAH